MFLNISRQAFVSESSCSEFSKMKFVPVSIVKVQITRMGTLLDAILKYLGTSKAITKIQEKLWIKDDRDDLKISEKILTFIRCLVEVMFLSPRG